MDKYHPRVSALSFMLEKHAFAGKPGPQNIFAARLNLALNVYGYAQSTRTMCGATTS